MAIALVSSGTLASLTQASGGSGTVAPTFAQATTAGNLLIAVVWMGGVSGTSIATNGTGWAQANSGSVGAFVFYKKNCGASEAAPTFNSNGGTYAAAALFEFSGADTSAPVDKQVSIVGGITSPQTADIGANDSAATDLVVVVWQLTVSKTATMTTSDSWTPAGGTKVATINDSAVKQIPHGYASFYVNTAGGAAHDINTLTFTPSTGSVSAVDAAIASFKVASTQQVVHKPIVVGATITRAGNW